MTHRYSLSLTVELGRIDLSLPAPLEIACFRAIIFLQSIITRTFNWLHRPDRRGVFNIYAISRAFDVACFDYPLPTEHRKHDLISEFLCQQSIPDSEASIPGINLT